MTKTVFGLALLLLTALPRGVFADPIPSGGVGQNVSVVGYSNLDDRPGFKMSIVESNGRWYLYMGHLWHFGWSIVDVTDPSSPKVAKFISGPANTWTIQMEISGNTVITALEQIAEARFEPRRDRVVAVGGDRTVVGGNQRGQDLRRGAGDVVAIKVHGSDFHACTIACPD